MTRIINFLKQKTAQIDKKYLSEGLFFMSISQIVGILIAAISAYFFANYVDKGTYGTYQFVLTMLGVMSIFTLRGVGKQIIRSYVKDGEMTLLPKTIQFIKYAIPVSGIGVLSGAYFYYRENTELAFSLIIISVLFPLIAGLPLYNSTLLAKHKFKQQSILNSIQSIVHPIALIIAILHGAGLLELIATFGLSHIIVLLLIFTYTTIKEKAYGTSLKVKNTSVEFHLSFGESILEMGKLVDKLAVFSLLGAASFASYMIAILPVRELVRLPQMLRTLILPKFSKYSFEQVRSKALEKTIILFVFFSFVTLIYILSAPFLFSLIFPLYPETVIYTQALSLILPFTSSLVIVQMFTVFDKTKELYISNTLFSISTIVLVLILTPLFGIWGVIYAKLGTSIIRFVSLILLSLRTH